MTKREELMLRIKIHNWLKWQHYKNRRPPWIKLYNSLLDKPEFERFSDESKLFLILIWLFRSVSSDDIPADEKYLRKKLSLKHKPKLQPLVDAGFIEIYEDGLIATRYQTDSKAIADCKQSAQPETEKSRDRDIYRENDSVLLSKKELETPSQPIKITTLAERQLIAHNAGIK